jgi:hypothetical protein
VAQRPDRSALAVTDGGDRGGEQVGKRICARDRSAAQLLLSGVPVEAVLVSPL